MTRGVSVAIVPAAGRGTRMLPASEAVPKELLPIGGVPAIDWVLEEAWACGIECVVVVTSPQKAALTEYLTNHYRHGIEPGGRYARSFRVGGDPAAFEVRLVEQREPLGLGDAVRTGWKAAGAGAVAVLLPDELVIGNLPPLRAMVELHERTRSSVVSLVRVGMEEISAYGCADVEGLSGHGALVVGGCVEKPAPGAAPSDLVLSGRYVLDFAVLEAIGRTDRDRRGEIQLTPALDASAKSGCLLGLECLAADAPVDVGNWRGWLRANEMAFDAGSLESAASAVA